MHEHGSRRRCSTLGSKRVSGVVSLNAETVTSGDGKLTWRLNKVQHVMKHLVQMLLPLSCTTIAETPSEPGMRSMQASIITKSHPANAGSGQNWSQRVQDAVCRMT